MCEATSETPDVSSPRLRVSHFLLVTTTCAIISSIQIAWTDWKGIPAEIHGYARVSILYSSILYGIALSCLLMFGWSFWLHGRASPRFPGHWLVVCLAVCTLLLGMSNLVVWAYTLISLYTPADFYIWNLQKIVLCSSIGTNCLVFAKRLNGSWWWKSVLILPGCVLLLLVPQHCLAMKGIWRPWFYTSHIYAQIVTALLVVLLVAIATVRDRRIRASYDWLHWTGVGVACLLAVGSLVEAVAWLVYYE